MRKIILACTFCIVAATAKAQWEFDSTQVGNHAAVEAAKQQDRRVNDPYQASPWFFGGGAVLGFSSNSGAVGLSPLAGYRITNYLDAGMGLSLIYQYNNYYERNRATTFALTPFLRAFPINSIFAQLQFEQGWINGSYISNSNKVNYNYDYQALIASLGYANRISGRTSFYMSIGIDLLKHKNSPYRYNDGRIMPVIATGINF